MKFKNKRRNTIRKWKRYAGSLSETFGPIGISVGRFWYPVDGVNRGSFLPSEDPMILINSGAKDMDILLRHEICEWAEWWIIDSAVFGRSKSYSINRNTYWKHSKDKIFQNLMKALLRHKKSPKEFVSYCKRYSVKIFRGIEGFLDESIFGLKEVRLGREK